MNLVSHLAIARLLFPLTLYRRVIAAAGIFIERFRGGMEPTMKDDGDAVYQGALVAALITIPTSSKAVRLEDDGRISITVDADEQTTHKLVIMTAHLVQDIKMYVVASVFTWIVLLVGLSYLLLKGDFQFTMLCLSIFYAFRAARATVDYTDGVSHNYGDVIFYWGWAFLCMITGAVLQ